MPGTKIYMISGRKGRTRIGDGEVDPTTITGDSVPVYDTAFVGSNGWDCTDWQAFHMALVTEYGQPAANQKWQTLWDAQDWNARPLNWCEYTSSFFDYFKSVGINVGDITADVLVPTTDAVTAVVADASNVVTNAANTASSLSNWLLPLAAVAVVAGGYFAYEHFLKPQAA